MELNFLNIEDCSAIDIETPTKDFQYIDYMTKNVIKDFTNIQKYEIRYSENNCDGTNESVIEVAPNYQFQLNIVDCNVVGFLFGGDPGSSYTIEVDGINPNIIDTVSYCFGGPCFPQGFSIVNGKLRFETLAVLLANVTDIEHRITTKCGFEYIFVFDIVGQTTDTSCDGQLSNLVITHPTPNAVVASPSSTISVNDLYSRPTLFPSLYYIRICEVNQNNNQLCLENKLSTTCGIEECIPSSPCDPTEDRCNIVKSTSEIHKAMIYGIQCCKQAQLNNMKHFIRIYCPEELTNTNC